MLRIAIIIGSTRPGRNGEAVGKWAYNIAQNRADAEFELVDLADFNLPLFNELMSPSTGQYSHQHTKVWSAKIASFDGYVLVTPEYNHGTSAALKNAIDFLKLEWVNKAAGFIGYGSMMGARAVEHLRLIRPRCRSRQFKHRSVCPYSQTSRISASSNRPRYRRSMSMVCSTNWLPGAALYASSG